MKYLRGYFADDSRKVIYIEVGKGQKLVFDKADNDRYLLGGKPLEIRAVVVEVRGDVKISSAPKKGEDNLQKVGVGDPGGSGGKGYGDGGGGTRAARAGQDLRACRVERVIPRSVSDYISVR